MEEDVSPKQAALKVTMFFPLYDNEGNVYDEGVWKWWRENLTLQFRGFTDMGVVKGWWQGHSDQNRWIVAVVKTQNEVQHIRQFLKLARAKFDQETMYLEYHRVHFEEVS